MAEGLIVKPTIRWCEEFRVYIAAEQPELLDFDHQLYLPDQFYIGQFKERNGQYQLSQEIVYRDLPEDLQRYEQLLAQRKLVVARTVNIPDGELADLVEKAKSYCTADVQVRKIIASLDLREN